MYIIIIILTYHTNANDLFYIACTFGEHLLSGFTKFRNAKFVVGISDMITIQVITDKFKSYTLPLT